MDDQIRIGKISSINYKSGMARVVYPDRSNQVTSELPFLATEYAMPKVGDMVLVVHLSNGMAAGVILGRFWSDANKPSSGAEGVYRKDLSNTPGETVVTCKDGVLTIKADNIVVDGKVSVTGDVTAGGKSLESHVHSMGTGNTSAPI